MNISLIKFAVQSIARVGRVSRQAAEQRARNADALFPGLSSQNLDRELAVNGFFNNSAEHKAHVNAGQPLAEFWNGSRAKTDKNAIDSLYVAALRISSEEGVDFASMLTPAGAVIIEQFDPDKGPMSPFSRIVLAAADIVLDYLAIDPGIASDNLNTQKLIGAFAKNLADYLPDDANFGPQHNFGQRLAAGFLRAGLSALSSNPEWVVDEAHMETLLRNSLSPIVGKFPKTIAKQIQWNRVTDTMIGPAAQAAMETVVANQTAFFGSEFDPDIALGAVTQALLVEAAEDGLRDQFKRDGLIGLYKSVLQVAVNQPELFIKDNVANEALARDALQSFSTALAKTPPPFDRTAGVTLASVAIDLLGRHAHRYADPANDWHGVGVNVFTTMASDFSKALKTNSRLSQLLSQDQLIEIGRIVLDEIANNPTLVSETNDEWRGVIVAITSSMAADKHLLLTSDDWKEIARVAASEASSNPARLFNLGTSTRSLLAARLIKLFLKAAADARALADGEERSVLSGKVLREAIIIALQAASGNAQAIIDHLPKVKALLKQINKLAIADHLEIGASEWLQLFRVLLGPTLDGTPVGDLSLNRAIKLLQGG